MANYRRRPPQPATMCPGHCRESLRTASPNRSWHVSSCARCVAKSTSSACPVTNEVVDGARGNNSPTGAAPSSFQAIEPRNSQTLRQMPTAANRAFPRRQRRRRPSRRYAKVRRAVASRANESACQIWQLRRSSASRSRGAARVPSAAGSRLLYGGAKRAPTQTSRPIPKPRARRNKLDVLRGAKAGIKSLPHLAGRVLNYALILVVPVRLSSSFESRRPSPSAT
jgi:hypothetical protein